MYIKRIHCAEIAFSHIIRILNNAKPINDAFVAQLLNFIEFTKRNSRPIVWNRLQSRFYWFDFQWVAKKKTPFFTHLLFSGSNYISGIENTCDEFHKGDCKKGDLCFYCLICGWIHNKICIWTRFSHEGPITLWTSKQTKQIFHDPKTWYNISSNNLQPNGWN